MIRAHAAVECVDALAKKWAVEIVQTLEHGPRRYNELRKEVSEQLTPKVFTRALRRLEAENIVRREVVNDSPPGVEYRLTAFGRSLLAALDDVAELWTRRHSLSLTPPPGEPCRAPGPAGIDDRRLGRDVQPTVPGRGRERW